MKFSSDDVRKSVELNRKEILKRVSDEDIFHHFLGIYPTVGMLIVSPLRGDRHPTFSFYNYGSKMKYKDFATGDTGDSFDLVQKLYNVSFYGALKIINKELKLGLGGHEMPQAYNRTDQRSKYRKKQNNRLLVQVDVKDFSNSELAYWAQFGITLDLLKLNNVYSCERVFMNKNLIVVTKKDDPTFAYHFPKSDNLKIYKPLNSGFKWFGNVTSNDIYGEHLFEPNGTLYLTSSGKDAMTLQALGHMAIAPQGEGNKLSKPIMNMIQSSDKIIILYDNDEAGMACSRKALTQIEENSALLGRAQICTLPENEQGCKDPAEFVQVYSQRMLSQAIDYGINKR
jgi:hypothetical protein